MGPSKLQAESIRRTQMRKVYLITAILLLSAVWVAAQSTPSSPSSTQSTPSTTSPSSTSPSQSTTPDTSSTTTQTTTTQTTQTSTDSSSSIEGCLNGSAGNYTLTDTSGKSWQLAGDTSKLSDHVGHQVRISGSEASGSASSSGPGASSANPSGSTSGNASGSVSGNAGAGSTGAGASASSQGTFTVSKVKMISSSCSTTSK